MTFGPGGGCSVSTDCSGKAFPGKNDLFLVFGGIGGASKGEPVMTASGTSEGRETQEEHNMQLVTVRSVRKPVCYTQ